MIKFETINGQLCRMVEQPCPHCGQPEIIATPVVEGSKEWALYQMMQGKAVTFFCKPNLILKLVNGYIQDSISGGFWNGKSGNEFLSFATKDGWKLHEPEQESIAETAPCPACHGTGFVDSVFMDEMAVRSSCFHEMTGIPEGGGK